MKALLVIVALTITAAAQNFAGASPSYASLPDATTTQRGLSQGYREANPIMRPFVTRGVAGQAAGSALGFGAGLGTVYLLHKTNHHKAERVAMRLMIGVQSAVVVNNYFTTR